MGKQFLFIVAPNKNSLYGENMPARLSCQVDRHREVNHIPELLLFDSSENPFYNTGSHSAKKTTETDPHNLLKKVI